MMFVHCGLTSRQDKSRDLFFVNKHGGRMYFDTLITRIEGMIHDVQRELYANNVEHETLDGLCFRGEQLARQVARLVTANVLDSRIDPVF